MKRNNKVIIAVCCATTIMYACSSKTEADNISISGNATLNSQHYEAVNVSGNLDANKITVTNNTAVSGDVKLTDSQIHSIAISGQTLLADSQVIGKVNISGNLTAVHSTIEGQSLNCSGDFKSNKSIYTTPISLSGNLNTEDDTFNDTITLSGNVISNHSTFNKVITISSAESTWTNSIVNSDIIEKIDTTLTTPTLTLVNSKVKGNIEFTKTKGLVILKGSSKVSGKVENAEVKHS